jgi:PAS domain S-box-containing protein
MASNAQPYATANYQSLQDSGLPFIVANRLGMVCDINEAFEVVFGWARRELIGEALSIILPAAHKMSHQLAFSRFQLPPTQSAVLGHPLRLATRCADGSEIVSEHFIIAEKRAGEWYFAATLKPLTQPA